MLIRRVAIDKGIDRVWYQCTIYLYNNDSFLIESEARRNHGEKTRTYQRRIRLWIPAQQQTFLRCIGHQQCASDGGKTRSRFRMMDRAAAQHEAPLLVVSKKGDFPNKNNQSYILGGY